MVVKTHVEANNSYAEYHDKIQPETYLMYWGATTLYGQAMSQLLPYKDI